MKSTMMDVPLSLNHLLERAGRLFAGNEILSRLPDKSLKRHTYGEFHRRARSLAAALQALGHAPPYADWETPLEPAPPISRREALHANAQWAREYVGPWVHRRLTGRSSGDTRQAKRPEIGPLA